MVCSVQRWERIGEELGSEKIRFLRHRCGGLLAPSHLQYQLRVPGEIRGASKSSKQCLRPADPLDRFHPISFPGGQLAHWCDDVPRRSSRRPMGRSKANRRVLSILSRTAWRPPSNTYTCTDAQYTDTLRMYTVYVYDI